MQDKVKDLHTSYCSKPHCLRHISPINLKLQLLIGGRMKFLMRVMREPCSFVYESILVRRLTGQMVLGDLNEIHV